MGQGIARLFGRYGLRTTVYDPSQNALAVAQKNLLHAEVETRETHTANALKEKCLKYTIVLEEAISEAEFIIESAPEDFEVKRQLYNEIGPLLKKDAIVASNTSSYPLARLSHEQPFADRLIIAHFFNPAHIIPLVELVKGENTKEGVAETIAAFLTTCGKVPVILKKDIRGFIANRLQAAVLREACFLIENGIADAGQIDTVMKESIGMRWAVSGPFQVSDYGGLDIWGKVLENLLPVLDNRGQVPAIISEKVKLNELGVKTGKGFFNYDLKDVKEQPDAWSLKLMKLLELKS